MNHKCLKIIPYCYIIGWPNINKFYYGVKFGIDANPMTFWKTYFTSSALVSQYRQKYGEPTLIKIRKVFDPTIYKSIENAQRAACVHETTVIRRLNMVYDNRFLNCSNNVCNRTGEQIINHAKYRYEKFGSYHSLAGIESMRAFNKVYSKNNNPMHRPEVKLKHLDSIAKKYGYNTYQEYVLKIKSEFEKYKTIKETASQTGHAQYTIRHLLLNNFGKEWVENIRKDGLIEARKKSQRFRKKVSKVGSSNPNAYVWEAISPTGDIIIIKGGRKQFCKDKGISDTLDINKPHLRNYWEFRKICKVKDYND